MARSSPAFDLRLKPLCRVRVSLRVPGVAASCLGLHGAGFPVLIRFNDASRFGQRSKSFLLLATGLNRSRGHDQLGGILDGNLQLDDILPGHVKEKASGGVGGARHENRDMLLRTRQARSDI